MLREIILLFVFLTLPFFGIAQTTIDSTVFTKDTIQRHFLSPGSIGNQIIYHNNYSLSYNEEAEQADWVFYKLTNSCISTSIERSNDFRVDPLVNEGSAALKDYHGSGYDRGHMAPAGSMKVDAQSMSQSFYMSNNLSIYVYISTKVLSYESTRACTLLDYYYWFSKSISCL